jgi:hypothetical protein
MADKRHLSPDHDGTNSLQLVKRQKGQDGQVILGSVTKDVSAMAASAGSLCSVNQPSQGSC